MTTTMIDRKGRVDITPVRSHVKTLLGLDWAPTDIAEAAGVTVQAVTNTTRNHGGQPLRWVQKTTADALLTVPLGPAPHPEAPQEPDAQTLTDRANLAAFMRRIHQGRRAA